LLRNLKILLDKVFPNESVAPSVPPTSCTDVLLIEQGSFDWLEAVVQSPKPSSKDSIDAAEKAKILKELWVEFQFERIMESVNVYDLVCKSEQFTTGIEQSFGEIIGKFSNIVKASSDYEFSQKTKQNKQNSFHRLEVTKMDSEWVLIIDTKASDEKVITLVDKFLGNNDDEEEDETLEQTFFFQNKSVPSDGIIYVIPAEFFTKFDKLRTIVGLPVSTSVSAATTTTTTTNPTKPFGIQHIDRDSFLLRGRLKEDTIEKLGIFFTHNNWKDEPRPLFGFTNREHNYFGLRLEGDESTGTYMGINIHWGSAGLAHCYIFWIPIEFLQNYDAILFNSTLDMDKIYKKYITGQNNFFSQKVFEGLSTYEADQLVSYPIVANSAGGKKQHKRSRKVPKKNLTRQTRKQ